MKVEINGKVYEQLPEVDFDLCHGCIGAPNTDEAYALCDKLANVGCTGFIWACVNVSNKIDVK